jgi:hypothetical protein
LERHELPREQTPETSPARKLAGSLELVPSQVVEGNNKQEIVGTLFFDERSQMLLKTKGRN